MPDNLPSKYNKEALNSPNHLEQFNGVPEGLDKPVGKIDPALLGACIHCGLCLPACPTYLATGREVESPRGRIYLLDLWQRDFGEENLPKEKKQEFTQRVTEHIDSCLGCLGCQTVCPSGVDYGEILNQARPALAKNMPKRQRLFMRWICKCILANYVLLRCLGVFLWLWQKLRGHDFLVSLNKIFPCFTKLALWEAYLPDIPEQKLLPKVAYPKTVIAGQIQGQVQLFTGCVMDIFYGQVNHAALRLMNWQGQKVITPKQTCCGALAFHAGDLELARTLAKENIDCFAQEPGPIIVTAAGCGAMLKEYPTLFHGNNASYEKHSTESNNPVYDSNPCKGENPADDNYWYERSQAFAERVQDLTEFLAQRDFPESIWQNAKSHYKKVAYHAACHLVHAQKVRIAPKLLLEKMAAALSINVTDRENYMQVVPLVDAELCCGSAGIYNLMQPELSAVILQAKIEKLRLSGADCLVTTNPGCLLQIRAGVKQAGLNIDVLHIAQWLAEGFLI